MIHFFRKIGLSVLLLFVLFAFKADEQPFNSKIQICLVVDFSNSAQETIEGVKNAIWKLYVDYAAKSPKTKLELAIVGYSSNSFGKENDYVKVLSEFDQRPSEIFDILCTKMYKGSVADNKVGTALLEAVNKLNWSGDENVSKHVFLIGNGPIKNSFSHAKKGCSKASSKGILVHGLYILYTEKDKNFSYWQQMVGLGKGQLKTIVSRYLQEEIHGELYENTKKIAEENVMLNATYMPYGTGGKEKLEEVLTTDKLAEARGFECLSNRTWYKSSKYFQNANSSWDLVDRYNAGGLDLKNIPVTELPEELKGKSLKEQVSILMFYAEERQSRIDIISILNYTNQEIRKDRFRNTPAFKLDLSSQIIKIIQESGN